MPGTLSFVINNVINGFGVPYNGAGSLYAAATGQRQSTVTYSGAGALSGLTAFCYSRSAGLSGSGDLTASRFQKYFMQYQEESTGTLSATTTSRYYEVKTMGLSGSGALTATAAQPLVLYDTSVVAGTPTSFYSSGTTLTWNHVNTGNYMFVSILHQGGGVSPTLSVTCNGNALSLLINVANGSDARLYLYGTNNLAIGNNTMQVTGSWGTTSCRFMAASTSFNNVSSLGALRTAASTNALPTITGITTTNNGKLFTILGFRNTSDTTNGLRNCFAEGDNGTGLFFSGHQDSTASTSSASVGTGIGYYDVNTGQFSATQFNAWAMITVPINR